MSDITIDEEEAATAKRRRPRRRLPEIRLPNGDTLVPRADFARDEIGVCERTVKRLDPPTTYIGGIAYVARDASLKIIGDTARRRNQPTKRRRRT
jgi:hypothetical protein